MSSLEIVNKTLKDIRGDTSNLNRNFEKWWKFQERQRLDNIEDSREQQQALKAMMASAAAAAGRSREGSDRRNRDSGIGLPDWANPAKWPTWLKLVSGYAAYKGVKLAANVVTAPARLGNKLGQKTIDAYQQYASTRAESAEAERKRLEAEARAEANKQADQLAELEYRADDAFDKARAEKARQARVAAYMKGQDEFGIGERLFRDQQIRIANNQITQKTLNSLQSSYQPNVPSSVDNSDLGPIKPSPSDVTPDYRPVTETAVPRSSSNFKAMSIDEILPTIDLANRTRADLDVMVGNDTEMKRAVQSIENQKGVKFVMQKNGRIAAFKIVNGNRRIMKAPELEDAIKSLRAATSKVVENKIKTNSANVQKSTGVGGKVGLGLAAVGAGATVSEALKESGLTGSIMDPKKVEAGTLGANLLVAAGGSFGDFSDFIYGAYAAFKGEEYTGQYGKNTRDMLKDTQFIKYLQSITGYKVGVGKKLIGVAQTAENIETNIGTGIMRVAKLLGGMSLEEIAASEGQLPGVQINKTELDNANKLMNEIRSNNLDYLYQPPSINIGQIGDNSGGSISGAKPQSYIPPTKRTITLEKLEDLTSQMVLGN